MDMRVVPDKKVPVVMKVIGAGGGGGNAVNRMIECNIQGVEFIALNTDAQALNVRSKAPTKIYIGQDGQGAGGDPAKAEKAAIEDKDKIIDAIKGAHLLFVTAGMGGGTGTGAAPVIAGLEKDMGILTVGVVTKPFEYEAGRMEIAEAGIEKLKANVDSYIVIDNEKIMEMVLQNAQELNYRIFEIPTSAILLEGKKIKYFDFISSLQNMECNQALVRIVPQIDMERIKKIIEETPFLSDLQKNFYFTVLRERKKRILDFSLELLKGKTVDLG